ncbi:MAG: sulfite exporter TauE/SafE family protein [Burkholderiaceae bacterium]|nr:sulfite exporter TauE/SafE family protein [Burkholderiaceae bacterium]
MPADFAIAPLFEGLDWPRIVALAAIYLLAFTVKGAIGVGSLTPTIVFGALVIDAHHAVALAVMANILSQMQFVREGFRHGDRRIARKVIVPNFAAAALGVWIFGRIGAPTLTTVLGLALGMLALCDMLGVWTRLAQRIDIGKPVTVVAISAFSGLVSGVTGAGGLLFVAIYLRMIIADKTVFRGTVLLLSTLVVAWRALMMAFAGHIDWQVVVESAVLFPLILTGGILGSKIHGRISERRFSAVLQAVILFGAAVLIWRGAAQILAR